MRRTLDGGSAVGTHFEIGRKPVPTGREEHEFIAKRFQEADLVVIRRGRIGRGCGEEKEGNHTMGPEGCCGGEIHTRRTDFGCEFYQTPRRGVIV